VLDFFDYHTNLKIQMLDKIMEYYHPDIIINGDDVCSSEGLFFSCELYDKFIVPFEQRFADAVKQYDGVILQHHVCGKCEDIIPDIIGYGTDVIETMQPGMNDIVKMKQLYGDKVIFNGGWDSYGHHNEPDATEEEVRAEVRRIIDAYCGDGRFIIYGGILIDTSNGWDRFNEMNGWVFDETRRYSSEMLRKTFG
jgi:uroporphyrinogen-III decarboxylase